VKSAAESLLIDCKPGYISDMIRTAVGSLTIATDETMPGSLFKTESSAIDAVMGLDPELAGWVLFVVVFIIMLTAWRTEMNAAGTYIPDRSDWELYGDMSLVSSVACLRGRLLAVRFGG